MSEIQFVDVDAEKIKNEIIRDFENALKVTLYPGDERRIFLLQQVPLIVGLKNFINETGKQNLLRYATGDRLDAIGGERTPRLAPQYAYTVLKFTLSGIQTKPVVIPKGTRATPDGQLYFATEEELVIASGQTIGSAAAKSTEPGEKYNGFAPGQIKIIVDPVPFVASVVNTDTSSGGADVEDDGHYRERIRQAPESYSTAGPEGGYVYWAKTADTNISDVSVSSPSPCMVRIVVLMKDGGIPEQKVLDCVAAAVNDRTRRPLTDNVQVEAPAEASYDITLTYYIARERQTEEAAIRNAIEGAEGAADLYKAWQAEKLGRAINPDHLRELMLNAGAFRIEVASPAYSGVGIDEVAKAGTVTLTYGGLI